MIELLENITLHSIMFLLILEEIARATFSEATLHSIMFLLIPGF